MKNSALVQKVRKLNEVDVRCDKKYSYNKFIRSGIQKPQWDLTGYDFDILPITTIKPYCMSIQGIIVMWLQRTILIMAII